MSEELRAELLRIAAKVARREYLPSLERCRTIQDARIEVARFDDFHAQLAQALKAIFDQAGRESLSAPVGAGREWIRDAADEIWLDVKRQLISWGMKFGRDCDDKADGSWAKIIAKHAPAAPEREADGWVSVDLKDQLPEPGLEVIVWIGVQMFAERHGDSWVDEDGKVIECRVTYWRKKVAPPTEEK